MRRLVPQALLLAVLVTTAGGCATQHRDTPAGLVSLPAVSSLAGFTAGTPVIASTEATQGPSCVLQRGGQVFGFYEKLALHGAASGAYAVFRFGPLLPGDRLATVEIESMPLPADHVAASEFSLWAAFTASGAWQLLGSGTAGASCRYNVDLAYAGSPHNGTVFLAIFAPPGSRLAFMGLRCGFSLTFGAVAHIAADLPEYEAVGCPIAIWLEAHDVCARLVPEFTGDGLIQLTGGNGRVLQQPSFTEGRAKTTLCFDEDGKYLVRLSDLAPALDRGLGSITAYCTPLPVYSLRIGEEQLALLRKDPLSKEYRRASIMIDGETFDDTGVRYRGREARRHPKPGWKVKLGGGQQYNDPEWGYEREILNLCACCVDPSALRLKLSYDLMQDLGLLSPRARLVHLRVNDQYQGLYTEVENPRRKWLRANGIDDGGALYKAEYRTHLAPCPELAGYEGQFEKKLREDEPYADLDALCRSLAALPHDDRAAEVEQLADLFDLELYTDYLVGQHLVSACDNWFHNYYLYHDECDSGLWLWIPWDLDLSWGISIHKAYRDGREVPQFSPEHSLITFCNVNPLSTAFYGCSALRARFKDRLRYALDEVFTEERMLGRIDELGGLTQMDILADRNKWGSNEDCAANVDQLRRYVRLRREYLLAAVERF